MPEQGEEQSGNPWHYSYILLSPAQKLLALDRIISNQIFPSKKLDDHTILNYTILRRMITRGVEAPIETLLHLEEKVMEWVSANGIDSSFFTEEKIVAAYNLSMMDIGSLQLMGVLGTDVENAKNSRSLATFFFHRRAFEDYVTTLAKKEHLNLAAAEQKARESSGYPASRDFQRKLYND